MTQNSRTALMRLTMAVAIAVLALALASCGGDDDSGEGSGADAPAEAQGKTGGGASTGTPREQIAASYADFVASLNAKDYEAACALISSSQLRALTAGKPCPPILAAYMAQQKLTRDIKTKVFKVPTLKGKQATAQVGEKASSTLPITFVKEDGTWKVSSGLAG